MKVLIYNKIDNIWVGEYDVCFNDCCYTDISLVAKNFVSKEKAQSFIDLHSLKDCVIDIRN